MNLRPVAATTAAAEKRREQASADLDAALATLRLALSRARGILESSPLCEEVCRAGHMASQAAAAVLRIVDAVNTEQRISDLEERLSYGRPRIVKKA